MRASPVNDPLALWRGVDDAVWREAARPAPAPKLPVPLPATPPIRVLEPA